MCMRRAPPARQVNQGPPGECSLQRTSWHPSPGRSTADGGSCALVNRGSLWCADANAVIDDYVFLPPPDDSRHLPSVATV